MPGCCWVGDSFCSACADRRRKLLRRRGRPGPFPNGLSSRRASLRKALRRSVIWLALHSILELRPASWGSMPNQNYRNTVGRSCLSHNLRKNSQSLFRLPVNQRCRVSPAGGTCRRHRHRHHHRHHQTCVLIISRSVPIRTNRAPRARRTRHRPTKRERLTAPSRPHSKTSTHRAVHAPKTARHRNRRRRFDEADGDVSADQ